jgi:hypothetical protein
MFMKLSKAFPTYEINSTGGGFWMASKQFKSLSGKYIEVQLHENGANVYALTDSLTPTEFASSEEYENDDICHENWIELHSMSGWHEDLKVEPIFDEETYNKIKAESKKFLKVFWGDAEYYQMYPDEKPKECERCGHDEFIDEYNEIEINYEEGIVLHFKNPKQLCTLCVQEIEQEVYISIDEPLPRD